MVAGREMGAAVAAAAAVARASEMAMALAKEAAPAASVSGGSGAGGVSPVAVRVADAGVETMGGCAEVAAVGGSRLMMRAVSACA